ncbi:Rv3235 family protein [Herbidospora mongoliensis]|uniref:Rv3235 family protein n=1 Tax=Herbidospora mongoliensis TaxID=688067 RepID=UPI000AEFD85A|nr:Rv3235 family protein [Herbidospora mongoliensis]
MSLPRLAPIPAPDPVYAHDRALAEAHHLSRIPGSLSSDQGGLPAEVHRLHRPIPRTQGSLALAHEPETAPVPGPVLDERRLRGLVQALAEILAGRRPPQTIQDRLSSRAYADLLRAGKMIDSTRPPWVGVPRVQHPKDDVAEMCALVRCTPRSRVLAARLERRGVQWVLTEFETA